LALTTSNGARFVVATAWTPGIARTLPMISLEHRPGGSAACASLGARTISTPFWPNPASTRCRLMNVRTSRPAPTRTMKDTAT
jgi:hypothetical protein